MKLITTVRAGDQVRQIIVEGATYDSLKQQTDSQVRDGEMLLSYRAERDDAIR
ncbi:hypothetical protein [Subtercola sp. YIM 133946]|uniref:hypothetical protein n=1 Tax=Subtercola sp. YIM 133946 TaxID=3118909 RepID=UPI002F957D20